MRPRSRRFVIGAAFAFVALAFLGIMSSLISARGERSTLTSALPGEDATSPRFDVEVTGCVAVLRDGACELPRDRTLRVWVGAPFESLGFELANVTLLRGETDGSVTGDGSLVRVVVASADEPLRVRSRRTGELRSIRLVVSRAPEWLAEANAKRNAGDTSGATALASTALRSEDPVDRAFALGLQARLELAAGRPEASFPRFRESIRAHRALGRSSDAADDGFALAFALNQRSHRYAEARSVLDEIAADVESYADGRARMSYYRGTLATELGETRAALRDLRRARDHAGRLGLARLERSARNAYAWQLELVGRSPEARDVLAELDADAERGAAPACERVEIAINRGYGALLAAARVSVSTSGPVETGEARLLLERAVALTDDACKDVYLRVAALGNLALAALARGDVSGARTMLDSAKALSRDVRATEVLFWFELEGRIALAAKDATRALGAFEQEEQLADATGSSEGSRRAATGRGEALELLGRDAEALAAYAKAEHVLDDQILGVPLGEGRGAFLGDRERSARLAVDLLVRRSRAVEALAVARRSRARIVASLAQTARVDSLEPAARARWEEALTAYRSARATLEAEARDDWKLPRGEATRAREGRRGREAELRSALDEALAISGGGRRAAREWQPHALPTGATTVAFHPARDGWAVFIADDAGVSARIERGGAPSAGSDDVAIALLDGLAERLASVKRLRILPYGRLRDVDFHALSVRGAPLGTHAAIEYPIDVPPIASASRGEETSALVVSDPTLDLEKARLEADHVAAALRARGWSVAELGGLRATSEHVREALGETRLLHYAGHGIFAGREAWESALPLASGGHLSVGDVLAARQVPSYVVLSGCETARGAEGSVESLGIAQAFVVAGAELVVAPVRPVSDDLAFALSSALYENLGASRDLDAASALRAAQSALARSGRALDATAFRVISR